MSTYVLPSFTSIQHSSLFNFQAYIMYMKYIQLASQIKKTKEYSNDKKFFDAMLPNGKGLNAALVRAEALGKSLEQRYNSAKMKIEQQKDNESAKKVVPTIKQDEKPSEKVEQTTTNGHAGSNLVRCNAYRRLFLSRSYKIQMVMLIFNIFQYCS